MSFSSHRRKLLDESEPLERRASHASITAVLWLRSEDVLLIAVTAGVR